MLLSVPTSTASPSAQPWRTGASASRGSRGTAAMRPSMCSASALLWTPPRRCPMWTGPRGADGLLLGGSGVVFDALDGSTLQVDVSFHGGLGIKPNITTTLLMQPYLSYQSGGADESAEDIAWLQDSLAEMGGAWDITRYSMVQHGFTVWGPAGSRYHAPGRTILGFRMALFEEFLPVEPVMSLSTGELTTYTAEPATPWTRPRWMPSCCWRRRSPRRSGARRTPWPRGTVCSSRRWLRARCLWAGWSGMCSCWTRWSAAARRAPQWSAAMLWALALPPATPSCWPMMTGPLRWPLGQTSTPPRRRFP
mmetsp:Transcript_7155/g.18494  ORF Transcript_7155/g.18494 Transcript_7155/m.18494 type:complete len:308 (+) Transcript_7155:544-1467(+)